MLKDKYDKLAADGNADASGLTRYEAVYQRVAAAGWERTTDCNLTIGYKDGTDLPELLRTAICACYNSFNTTGMNVVETLEIKHDPGAMEKLLAGYVNARLDSYLMVLEK